MKLDKAMETTEEHWGEHTGLAKKVSDLGQVYLENFPVKSFSHSNQRHAQLLVDLKENTDKAFVFRSIIAILYALPKRGQLSAKLTQYVAQQNVQEEGLHTISPNILNPAENQPTPEKIGSYFYPITHMRGANAGFNKGIANALYAIDVHYRPQPAATDVDESLMSFADKLAMVGRQYLNKYPRETSTLYFFNRHTHQCEASLLGSLQGKTDELAIERAAQLLLNLSGGQLSKEIRRVFQEEGQSVALAEKFSFPSVNTK